MVQDKVIMGVLLVLGFGLWVRPRKGAMLSLALYRLVSLEEFLVP